MRPEALRRPGVLPIGRESPTSVVLVGCLVPRFSLSVLVLALVAVLTGSPAFAAAATPGVAGRAAVHHRHPHHRHAHRHHHRARHHRHAHHRHAAKVRTVPVATGSAAAVPFQVGSFNALGASHTDGRHPERPGWRNSAARIRDAGALFLAHGLDIVGVQEFQPRQQAAFRAAYGDTYDVLVGDGPGRPNGVVWRRSRFALVSTSMVTVPYFWGQPTPMPLVTLQDRRTGRLLMVLSVHNPADTHGNAQRWRDAATAHELTTLSALRAAHPGTPVLWLGDMNDHATFFCAATAGGVFHAAAGGGNDASGCLMPDYFGIDWVLGSRNLAFSGWTVDRSTQDRRISDHPMVFSTAVLGTQAAPTPVPAVPGPVTVPGVSDVSGAAGGTLGSDDD